MNGAVARLMRHPVKGFTPEELESVSLTPGAGFPWDRSFAVEDGPSGFDAAAPAHITKQKFTVLAKIPAVARIRTRFDDASQTLHAEAPPAAPISAKLNTEAGRIAFADWLSHVLRDGIQGPLRVLPAPGAHRFYDHPEGFVSIINLASVRDIGARLGRQVDPLRFRANVYVEGWPAWCELNTENQTLGIGAARLRVFKSITRCLATHIDPDTGARDIEMVEALHREYGHIFCGVYAHVEQGGVIACGDAAALS